MFELGKLLFHTAENLFNAEESQIVLMIFVYFDLLVSDVTSQGQTNKLSRRYPISENESEGVSEGEDEGDEHSSESTPSPSRWNIFDLNVFI